MYLGEKLKLDSSRLIYRKDSWCLFCSLLLKNQTQTYKGPHKKLQSSDDKSSFKKSYKRRSDDSWRINENHEFPYPLSALRFTLSFP
jgi:hypothetical protein